MDSKIEQFFKNEKQWKNELELLRDIILKCDVTEELKWGVPCYTYQGKNLFLIGGFKAYFTISFLKGTLLNDENELLEFAGTNSQ